MDVFNSLQSNEHYKKLNKQGNCSNCDVAITRDIYKRRRTVYKFFYNNQVLAYYKSRFRLNTSPKSDVSTQTEFSYK